MPGKGQAMTVTYIKQFRDDLGEIIDEQNADNEIRWMNREIELLKATLEIEMQAVADLRELLDAVRKIAFDINEQLLRGGN
jgi:negative regulator of replication initiation